jgi:hypothetical protein
MNGNEFLEKLKKFAKSHNLLIRIVTTFGYA